jgi:hypothetical protein
MVSPELTRIDHGQRAVLVSVDRRNQPGVVVCQRHVDVGHGVAAVHAVAMDRRQIAGGVNSFSNCQRALAVVEK